MENLKKITFAAIILMVSLTTVIIAQPVRNNRVPDAVIASFIKKYPRAKLKSWKMAKGICTAKFIIDDHKSFATFDKSGNWLSTASNIRWAWNLPKAIKKAYHKTNYNNWNIYFAKRVERPSGEFYQLLVDDTNLHVGQTAQPLYTTNKLLEFKADGALAMVKDITEDPAP